MTKTRVINRDHNVKLVQSCKGWKPEDAFAAMRLLDTRLDSALKGGKIAAVRPFLSV